MENAPAAAAETPKQIHIQPKTTKVAEPEQNLTVRKKISFERPQSISITKPATFESQQQQSVSVVSEPVPNLSFTSDDFMKLWNVYGSKLEDEKRIGFKNLNIPQQVTDTHYELTVNNVMQQNEAKGLVTDALEFIRVQINNKLLQITIKVIEESEIVRRLTPEQQFQEMVAKNPLLEEFRKRLHLEID